ncbi:PTS fructose transporter subunit IIA [Sulfurifustis variabilis]|uniref:PTS fructose transporter subunit IIA n=1 Tax=Sulfurifustis variabilis TaxID=1675686 RepID=A0A1B4V161_9GAMM|nr:PTS sugar transporter subunit IIA [Sulfurifustis variabilis]BAU47200.1 PTS fructose transporter subunit IIA [Sulfurifustis variabilis]
MHIQDLLSQRRVLLGMPVSSKKRLLEKLGELLGHDAAGLNAQQAFQALIDRERLGSTGIGEGVALPHGRVKGLARPVGAFCTLERAMDFDSIDHKPVTMVFALLVPERANEEHLKILSELAGLFSNKAWRQGLLAARSPEDLYARLTGDAARPDDSQAHDR